MKIANLARSLLPASWTERLAQPSPTSPRATGTGSAFIPDRLDAAVIQLSEVADPDVVLERLGKSRADLRQMLGDEELTQCLETRRDAVIATPWRIEPQEADNAEDRVQWLQGVLESKIERIISAAWLAVPYGYGVAKTVYTKPEQGAPATAMIGGLADVEALPFEEFRIYGDNRWRRSRDGLPPTPLSQYELDYLYHFTVRNPTSRNPYGESLLSRAYWPYFYRHNIWRFWMQALERHGTPTLIGHTDGDQDQLAEDLQKAVQDAAIAVGHGDKIEALQTPGSGDDFDKVDARITSQMQKLILGQTLTSQVGSTGSYAAANVHDRVRKDKRDSDITLITPTIQRIVNALWIMRFGVGTSPPTFIMKDSRWVQQELADRDQKFVSSNSIRFTKGYYEKTYGFAPEDFDLAPEKQPEPQSMTKKLAAWEDLAARRQRYTQDQDDVEQLIDSALTKAKSPIAPERIIEVIKGADNAEEIADGLAALYEGDDQEEFRELLEQTIFYADALGYINSATRRGQ